MELKQRDFGWLAELKAPGAVPPELLKHCRSAHDAILLTWNARGVKRSMSDAAAILGMPKSHLSNILAGKKYLPDDLRIPFMWLCGNIALRQWEDEEMRRLGLDRELVEAEMHLAELKARRAA